MDACLFCSRELNSGEITSSSWDCSGVLHEHFDHVDFALVERAHTHAHAHTLTHTRTLLWIVANSIIAWSNHFQIQWRHLCQVHRRSRKHTHTETQTQTHTHIHTHTHTPPFHWRTIHSSVFFFYHETEVIWRLFIPAPLLSSERNYPHIMQRVQQRTDRLKLWWLRAMRLQSQLDSKRPLIRF